MPQKPKNTLDRFKTPLPKGVDPQAQGTGAINSGFVVNPVRRQRTVLVSNGQVLRAPFRGTQRLLEIRR